MDPSKPGTEGQKMSQLSPAERLDRLVETWVISTADAQLMRESKYPFWASSLGGTVENMIGTFPVPLAVATGFVVNGVERPVLMATEERSVVAAASRGAELALPEGFKVATQPRNFAKAQILFSGFENAAGAYNDILGYMDVVGTNVKEMCDPLKKHGGGFVSLMPRLHNDEKRGVMMVVDVTVDAAEAMGALAVTKMSEEIAELLRPYTKHRRTAVVSSNDSPGKAVTAEASWDCAALGAEVVSRILDLQAWAEHDPQRAAAHNKEIMDGVSAVCLATGQDLRAVEAAAHVEASKAIYQPRPKSVADFKAVKDFVGIDASRRSAYHPLSSFQVENGRLVGTLKMPLQIGTVGGATGHPLAVRARRIMKTETVAELAAVIGAVGLAQNFAALRMLADEGVIGSRSRLG